MIFILYFFFLFPIGANAQQNFFNIPSGQMTSNNEFFYQHQMNMFSKDAISSKQHFVFGFLENFEAGFNFLNLYPMGKAKKDQEGPSPHSNVLALTLQKSFKLSESFSINVGTQTGVSHIGMGLPSYTTGKHYAVFTFFESASHARLTAGPWVADERFNGKGDTAGFMFGGEWMFSEGFYLMGDWVSGNTKNSVSVIGGMIDLSPGFQVCGGYLIPNPQSSEGHGLVLELNIFTL